MIESRSVPGRSDVSFAATAPRATPTGPRASKFGEVLGNTVVRTAESAMRVLPGSPLLGVAVRGGVGSLPISSSNLSVRGPEGPGGAGSNTMPTATGLGGVSAAGGTNTVTGGTGVDANNIEGSLQQSQDLNMYYLQVQKAVNDQNQRFTMISNLLKAEHDTVKTAIGNIR